MEIKETYVNESTDMRYGSSDWYEPYTNDTGKLFKSLQKEFGRCTSKIYVDVPMGDGTYDVRTVGWVFLKKQKYTDTKETYLQSTWVEIR